MRCPFTLANAERATTSQLQRSKTYEDSTNKPLLLCAKHWRSKMCLLCCTQKPVCTALITSKYNAPPLKVLGGFSQSRPALCLFLLLLRRVHGGRQVLHNDRGRAWWDGRRTARNMRKGAAGRLSRGLLPSKKGHHYYCPGRHAK